MERVFFLLLVSSLFGCVQAQNSSSQDADLYAVKPTGSAAFSAAQSIFSQSCTPCHSFNGMSETDLIASGRVHPGDAENSTIYNRLRGSTGPGTKDMPQTGTISAADVEAIKTWINQITP